MAIKLINYNESTFKVDKDLNIEGVDITLEFPALKKPNQLLEYSITVSFPDTLEDKKFTQEFKELCGLRFSPYDYKLKSYRFFTSKYVTQDNEYRAKILNDLLNASINQVEVFKVSQESAKKFYENEFPNLKPFKTEDLACIPVGEMNGIVAIPRKFLDPQKFANYRSISSEFKKADSLPIDILEYVTKESNIPFKSNTSYFFVGPEIFEKFMTKIQSDKDATEKYKQEQIKVGDGENLSQYDITEENPFNLKIKYNKEEGHFEFYCKGYVDTYSPFGDLTPKTLLGVWAKNFILCTSKEDLEGSDFHSEIYVDDKLALKLKTLGGSSAKNKSLLVPADEHLKIKEIYDNWQTEKNFWLREEKALRIHFRNLNIEDCASKFPFIHFEDNGNAMFVNNIRHSTVKSKSPFMTFRGISVTPKEVEFFLKEHPLSEKILRGTKYVVGCFNSEGLISEPVIEESFNKTYEKYKLTNELQATNTTRKKMKI